MKEKEDELRFGSNKQSIHRKHGGSNGTSLPDSALLKIIHPASFYNYAPLESELSLMQFENIGADRVKLLRAIESQVLLNASDQDMWSKLVEMKEGNLIESNDEMKNEIITDDIVAKREKDRLSHFIILMAYCGSEENRRWFVTQEAVLFKLRYERAAREQVKLCLKFNNIKFEDVSKTEKDNLLARLLQSTTIFDATLKKNVKLNPSTDFYKIPFTEALPLVKKRRVFLLNGYAYVPTEILGDVVADRFKEVLSVKLCAMAKKLPNMGEEERLLPILKNITLMYAGRDCDRSLNLKINLNELDKIARQSFAPCMLQMHLSLRRDHHLRHGGRLQLGLFLKGIGLTLDQSLQYWRNEFSRNPAVGVDKFEKNYAYSIRHNYGREGARKNYTPYGCMKIISSPAPGPTEIHGCPFKTMDQTSLQKMLEKSQIPPSRQQEILQKAKENHLQIACTRFFEAKHNLKENTQECIIHPNQYFEDSAVIYGYSKNETDSTTKEESVDIVMKNENNDGVKIEDVKMEVV